MAVDKLVDSTQLNADLTSVANAIRTKGGTSAQMAFPNGFVNAVNAIPTGVTPTGTKQISITENGTVTEDVAAYANAEITVNVSGGGGTDNLPAFLDGTLSGALTIPDITYLKSQAISYLNDLTSLSLPDLVTTNTNAIYTCFGLTSLSLPKLKTSSNYGLASLTALPSLTLPSLTSAATFFCSGNRAMTIVDLGPNCTSLGGQAFAYCSSIQTLILRRSTELTTIAANTFIGTRLASGGAGCTIYIPKTLYDHLGDGSNLDYQHATNWSVLHGYGTITWAQIEGSAFENAYADGTPIT